MARHELLDGVEMNRRHPAAARIPSAFEKAQIQPGDYVKVGFIIDQCHQEFLWVKVVAVNGKSISAILDDDPVYADVRFAEKIEIEPRHVLRIER
jgi:hypothetical protein